ncbi:unnamed protein product [Rhizophagus irregularis]|uniref:Uncharacterized protein n=1 Tax=Rhizophagus irregularis TaxID=588596 RepID=A0A2N1MN58_9GLOM|nr:hypothetical protein RhiirC2_789422 [Rhizophagus irregularis]CAB4382106.1 unnamed protein product [Rhizophagus irregularis]CAB5352194.1 unnamed protein product [Rhizophagus irregularis]
MWSAQDQTKQIIRSKYVAQVLKVLYNDDDVKNRIQKLVNLYEKLEKKGVPNIDHLDCYNKEGDIVYLSPKGLKVVPKNQQELFEAIVCVLEALTDIRWDNIVQQHNDPSKWFLIDSTTRFLLP